MIQLAKVVTGFKLDHRCLIGPGYVSVKNVIISKPAFNETNPRKTHKTETGLNDCYKMILSSSSPIFQG